MSTFEEQLQESLSQTYDIERELGGGGMSRVFVATEKSLGRKVVIKLLSPELTAEVNRGRFRREIQVAAQLQHPHIVTLLAAGEYGDLVYYTMPFIRGESLKHALEKDGPMAVEDVVRVLYDVIDALAYAHENGVVHRDIKPANILTSGQHALVTDFGVAKALNAAMASGGGMTSTGMAIGTPAYMSPEQLAGDPSADHRIDIYAVGLLAYELLAGKSPFSGKNPRDVLAAVLTREPPPLNEVRVEVPARLSEMVMSCLAKDPDARPAAATALIESLDKFASSSGEIRTREYRVPSGPSTSPATPTTSPVIGSVTTPLTNPVVNTPTTPLTNPVFGSPTTPLTNPVVNAELSDVSRAEQAEMDGVAPVSTGLSSEIFGATKAVDGEGEHDGLATYQPTKSGKRRPGIFIGALVFIIAVAAGGIFLLRSGPEAAPVAATIPVDSVVIGTADSTAVAQTPVPGAAGVTPAAPVVDSLAPVDTAKIRAAKLAKAKADSVKRAARVDSIKRAIAVKDSLRVVAEQQNSAGAARRAAAAVLGNAEARRNFMKGATRSGGLLGAQKKGDLQTQIDAMMPFLRSAGLTYDQFKRIVQDSGVNMFDQFGRIVPDSLQRFASGG